MRIRDGVAAAVLLAGLMTGLAGPAMAEPVTTDTATSSDVSASAAAYGGVITRAEVMTRAKDWWTRQIPYSQSAYASDINRGKTYRTDCSGYISMAWKLTSSRNTSTLDEVATRISWSALQPGDMILRVGHVKLFEKWANTAKTSMWIYEEGSTSTDMDHETVSVATLQSGDYLPWKYRNIR